MLQLTYISTVAPSFQADSVDEILAISRRNNDRVGLSGLLIFDGRRFLQAIEGEQAPLMATFNRIKADPRHRALVLLSKREIGARQFGNWAMAWNRVSPVATSDALAGTVDALVAEVQDANTRELFRSFARIVRKAA